MPAEQTPRLKPSKRPRYRYILFEIQDKPPERASLIRQLQLTAAPQVGAWLTRYEDGRGILRVLRGQEKEGRRLLENLAGLTIRCLLTSGTIAALERSHGRRDRHNRRSG